MYYEAASLRGLVYFGTGGRCRGLYLPRTRSELLAAWTELGQRGLPYIVLGAGSNSLVSDLDWPGLVLSLQQYCSLEFECGAVIAQAGVLNSSLVEAAAARDLGGLEWMNGLPGQLGATVRMNARCYGGEISQVVRDVLCLQPGGAQFQLLSGRDPTVFVGYKDTVFMRQGLLVAEVRLAVTPGADRQQMLAVYRDRHLKGQYTLPSCGCVFKNDYSPAVGVSSGVLLDLAGAKGLRRGKAFVSEQHANFIFHQQATSREILELSLAMREAVWQKFGVWLSYEMEILGEVEADLAARLREMRQPVYHRHALALAREEWSARGRRAVANGG